MLIRYVAPPESAGNNHLLSELSGAPGPQDSSAVQLPGSLNTEPDTQPAQQQHNPGEILSLPCDEYIITIGTGGSRLIRKKNKQNSFKLTGKLTRKRQCDFCRTLNCPRIQDVHVWINRDGTHLYMPCEPRQRHYSCKYNAPSAEVV